MKTITKFAAVALLAISAATPAFATDPEALQLEERNTYVYSNGPAGPAAQYSAQARAHRAIDALAQAPVGRTPDVYVKNQNAIDAQ